MLGKNKKFSCTTLIDYGVLNGQCGGSDADSRCEAVSEDKGGDESRKRVLSAVGFVHSWYLENRCSDAFCSYDSLPLMDPALSEGILVQRKLWGMIRECGGIITQKDFLNGVTLVLLILRVL